jgi:hypothetical protein
VTSSPTFKRITHGEPAALHWLNTCTEDDLITELKQHAPGITFAVRTRVLSVVMYERPHQRLSRFDELRNFGKKSAVALRAVLAHHGLDERRQCHACGQPLAATSWVPKPSNAKWRFRE